MSSWRRRSASPLRSKASAASSLPSRRFRGARVRLWHDSPLHRMRSALHIRRPSFVLLNSANAAPPGGLIFSEGAGRNPPFQWPPQCEGGEAPKGAGAERRTRGPPRGRAGLRITADHRPITPAGAPFGASLRRSYSDVGPRFRPDTAPDRQPAPGGRLVVASRAEPRQRARVQDDKSHPRAPHPAPPSAVFRKTPLGEQDNMITIMVK